MFNAIKSLATKPFNFTLYNFKTAQNLTLPYSKRINYLHVVFGFAFNTYANNFKTF